MRIFKLSRDIVMMLGRINEGGILVQEQFPRLGVYRVWASAELKGEGKKGERERLGERRKERERSKSLCTINAAGVE